MIRAALLLFLMSAPAFAADWSKWSTWQTADPRVKSTAAFNARYGAGPSARTAYATADGVGGAVYTATRNFNGVFEVSKSYPVSRAQVAAMARGAARAFGYAGLAISGAQAVIDALNQGGVSWDESSDDWVTYPEGEFYYADYAADFDFTPDNYLYRHRDGPWMPMIPTSVPCEYAAEAMGGGWVCAGDMQVIEWFSGGSHWKRVKYHIKYVADGHLSGWRYSAYLERTSAGCSGGEVAAPGGGCWPMPSQTQRQPTPATDPQMETAVSDATGADPSKAPAIAEGAAKAGAPIPYTPSVWTGPSSVPGESSTSTSTGPAGTTTTTRVVNHGISYGPGEDDVTVTDDETVTTTAPDGQTTTTTTTTTGTTTTGGDSGGTGTATANPCALNPNASGCAPLGEVEDTALETADVNVNFSAPSVAGSCPAPIILPVLGTNHELKWDPLCEFAERTSPIVRAMAILSAGIWVVFMFRRG